MNAGKSLHFSGNTHSTSVCAVFSECLTQTQYRYPFRDVCVVPLFSKNLYILMPDFCSFFSRKLSSRTNLLEEDSGNGYRAD